MHTNMLSDESTGLRCSLAAVAYEVSIWYSTDNTLIDSVHLRPSPIQINMPLHQLPFS